jgi:hypothetical protein
MIENTVFSLSTQRATPEGVRARVATNTRKDFSCFSGFGARSANQSLSPPKSGPSPNSP